MAKLPSGFVVAAVAIGLVGCGASVPDKIATVEGKTPTGSAFGYGLHQGYVQQAKLEAKEYDFRDADRWIAKASATSGGGVGPEELGRWKLPKDSVDELATARARLVAALAAGASTKAPAQAARAQVSFDCWVQEKEENHQPDDIRACKSGFESAMANVDEAMKPRMAAEPAPKTEYFTVFFDTDSDALTPSSQSVISLILQAAKKAPNRKVSLAGHTDLAGGDTYNDVLSKKRVDAVAAALLAAGLSASTVDKSILGESEPRIPTLDGVRERLNRRVEVTIE